MLKFILLGLISSQTLFAAAANPVVLVYRGPGACTDGCAEAAAEIPASMGFEIRYVTSHTLTEASFENAVLWVQAGGNAIKASKSLGRKNLELIKKHIRYQGMGYVGFCAGAFLADEAVDDEEKFPGLGLIPFGTRYYQVDSQKDGIMHPLTFSKGVIRYHYFNGGGTFDLRNSDYDRVDVLAKYPNGDPALLQTTYGMGNVVIIGAHPEATAVWKSYTHMSDPDGSDHDIARDMVRRALPKAYRKFIIQR